MAQRERQTINELVTPNNATVKYGTPGTWNAVAVGA